MQHWMSLILKLLVTEVNIDIKRNLNKKVTQYQKPLTFLKPAAKEIRIVSWKYYWNVIKDGLEGPMDKIHWDPKT